MSYENPAISIGALRQEDLPAALNVQRDTYPSYLLEEEAAFLSRVNLAASYCLAAWHRERLVGYLLAHGWKRNSPPTLGSLLADDVPSEVLFIHDLAVSPDSRGLRVGQSLIAHAFKLADQDGLRSAELIAVEGAADYWRRFGFVEAAVSCDLAEKLGTYGTLACFMTRAITPHA